jgi:hypothetical protein
MLRIFVALFMFISTPVFANSVVENYVPDAQKVGEGRLTYMFWDVYDTTLYAPQGQWQNTRPFALKLSYLRDVSGGDIVYQSIKEIRDQGVNDEIKLAAWHTQLKKIFPNVVKGSSLIGIYKQTGETIFYDGEYKIGQISNPEFGRLFFNIWLGEKTNVPHLRKKLLGRSS